MARKRLKKSTKKKLKSHFKEKTVSSKKRRIIQKHFKNQDMVLKKKKLVAVYGTLLSKCANHGHLQHAKLKGIFQTEPKLSLFLAPGGGYPYIMENGNQSITMEVYELNNPNTEARLDGLEGVASGLYKKMDDFKTPFGTSILYIRKEMMEKEDQQILSGNWKEYKKVGL